MSSTSPLPKGGVVPPPKPEGASAEREAWSPIFAHERAASGAPSARNPPATPVRTLAACRAQLPPPDFRLPGGGDGRRFTRAPRHSWRAAGRRRRCPVPLGQPSPVAPPRASTGDVSPFPSPAARPKWGYCMAPLLPPPQQANLMPTLESPASDEETLDVSELPPGDERDGLCGRGSAPGEPGCFLAVYDLRPLRSQGPLFGRGIPVTVRVEGTERYTGGSKVRSSTLYALRVTHGGFAWTMKKKFRHFQELHWDLLRHRLLLSFLPLSR
ncbi:hypothetical protein lerEdw1_006466 [Lerista edwardsae]|nr:hypothetical protein lerEdw1_006466 [Lerista edwardsae]